MSTSSQRQPCAGRVLNRRVPRLLVFGLAASAMPLLAGCELAGYIGTAALVGTVAKATAIGVGVAAAEVAVVAGAAAALGPSRESRQDIQFTVAGPPTADCVLSNEQGQWTVQVPGKVSVERSAADLTLSCRQAGYEPATALVPTGRRGYPDSVQITMVPLCAADDAGCLARRAEAQQRAAEEAAAAEAARAAARETPGNPDAGAAEQQTALAAEQGKFDAWYAGNQETLRDAVNRVVRDEGLLSGCFVSASPTRPVSIARVEVTGVQADGQVANITYTKQVELPGCDQTRTDSFLLRIVNDVLLEVDYLGPASTALQATVTPAPEGPPPWAGAWYGEVDLPDGKVTLSSVDGALTVYVLYAGVTRETTGYVDDEGRFSASLPVAARAAAATVDVEGIFPHFTVKFFTGNNNEPDRTVTLTRR